MPQRRTGLREAGLFEGKVRAAGSMLDRKARGVSTDKAIIKLCETKLFYVPQGRLCFATLARLTE